MILWPLLHIYSLWVPYVFGASPQYAKMYERVWGRTTKLLPNFGNHLAPDAMHVFIDPACAVVLRKAHQRQQDGLLMLRLREEDSQASLQGRTAA